eukprot:UN06512
MDSFAVSLIYEKASIENFDKFNVSLHWSAKANDPRFYD